MQMVNKGYFLSFFFILVFGLFHFGVLNAQEHGDHSHATEEHAHGAEEDHGAGAEHGHGAAHGAGDIHCGDHHGEVTYPELMKHHIKNTHNWHLFDYGHGEHDKVEIMLPWLVYSEAYGLDFFMHGDLDPSKYCFNHEKLNIVENGQVTEMQVLDLSPNKTVIHIFIVCLVMILIFTSVAKSYKKRAGMAPKGLQSLLEPVIVFVKEDIADNYLGKKSEKFLPYLLTVFFFIWISNLFGLMPFNFNITGSIIVCFVLALLTMILTMANTNKHFWGHVFWFPGAPVPVKILMIPIELVGIISKPFALMIRLFANITGGHFMVLSLIGLIFIMGDNGNSVGGAIGGGFLSVLFTTFILCLEMLVAALQAYVFTLLTAVFIGQAMEGDHAEDHH